MAMRSAAPSKRRQKKTAETKREEQKNLPIIHGKEQGGLSRTWNRVMDPIDVFRRDMDLLFDDIFHGFDTFPLSSQLSSWMDPLDYSTTYTTGYDFGYIPPVEMTENEGSIKVRVELPGLEEKDIEVRMTDDKLIIKGDKKGESDRKTEEIYCSERSYGSFRRELPIMRHVDSHKVEATFHNGVLDITLPKLMSEKSRKIVIKGH